MRHTGINNYWIDENGTVFNMNTNRKIKWSFNKKNGYYSVGLSDGPVVRYRYVHRLMGFCYHPHGYFEGADINHEDGNKANNNYRNLKWCTRKENIKHAFRVGLSDTKGSRNSQSKLDEKQVATIKLCLPDLSNYELSKYFKVKPDTIRSIRNGKNWKHV